jgi:hypothetical protein
VAVRPAPHGATTTYPTIRDLGGSTTRLLRHVTEDRSWSAFNPSVARHPKRGYAMTVRSSNYEYTRNGVYRVLTGPHIRNRLWFAELDRELRVKDLREVDTSKVGLRLDRGIEDARLFFRDGAWHFTCVMYEDDHTPVARLAVGVLDAKATRVVHLERVAGLDPTVREKNWMVSPDPTPEFDFVYGPNMTVRDSVLTAWMTDNREVAGLRGGSNLHPLGDGTYLAVVHRMVPRSERTWMPDRFSYASFPQKTYIHYFARYDERGFVVAVSKGFVFEHLGVEFAAGLTDRDDDLLVSYGSNDASSHVAVVPLDTALRGLKQVEY